MPPRKPSAKRNPNPNSTPIPPRKPSAKPNKPSSTKTPTPVVKSVTELANDSKVNDPEPEVLIPEEELDSNRAAEIKGVGSESESMAKEEEVLVEEDVNEPENEEDDEPVDGDGEPVNNDELSLQQDEDDDVEEFEDEEEEIISAQEEMNAFQVDDLETLNDNNNDQDSDISKLLCENSDALVVNNGDLKGTTEMVSIQESAQVLSTQTSHENNTALAVEDDSMVNMDSDEADDFSEGDDADNEGDGGQDPSLIVQDSSDNKKEKGTEIYVGNLDKNAVEDDLISAFQQFGELISTRIVRKPKSTKSKCFGFVRFASVDQAQHALSELKDGVEVRGKPVLISASQDNNTLYLGNICKTWTKEQVVQQLQEYGIERITVLRVPEDSKLDRKNKGFAFLEFSTHPDAVAAFQLLKKPDVFFGRDTNAKVAFSQTPLHSRDADLSKVNEVHLEGLTKDWNEEKVKDICKNYGEILNINLCPGKRNKRRDFGFVTFKTSESALACVEGINSTATEGEAKMKASLAKQQSQPRSSKMKGVLHTQQTRINKRHPSRNKINNTVKPQQKGSLIKDREISKEAESSKMKGDNDHQQPNRKRKVFSEQKSSARDLGTPKKQRIGGQGQNSQPVSRAGGNKRKNPLGNEVRGDRGNRNAQGKKPLKKQRGNMHGRERDNFRKSRSDTHSRRGHDDYRNSTRYAPHYAASASNAYHVASDRYKEMEPHAGYIEPAYGNQSGSYSGYVQQPLVQTPHNQYQTMYQPRYVDRPVMTQSHRGYIETPVAREVQPYRDYNPPANVQIARDHYDPGRARIVRHDDRGAGALTYVGGPPHQPSQVPNHTNYYQAGGSYSGAYGGNRGAYY